ncbi:MAG TPA: ABC transporter permease subunit [Candidatus Sulfotelmatobacter sp.]|nr:ABC transporter permease subunit [Candidatus Sulfotelmatobacter sp.]
MFFAQLKNELWKLFGKKRTYIGFGAFVVALSAMLLIFKYTHWQPNLEGILSVHGYLASEYISVLTVALIMIFPQVALLMPLYVTLVGGDLVAKEAEDGTLRMILSRPVSRVRLLLVKWIAGIIFTAVLVVALGVIALGFAGVCYPWRGMFVFGQIQPGADMTFSLFTAHQGLVLFAVSHVFIVINTITLMSVAFMFSCFNMKPAAATILALSFMFVSMVMERIPFFDAYQDWFITHHLECWFLIFQQPTPWQEIYQSELILAATSATAFIIGVMGFQVRDIKS